MTRTLSSRFGLVLTGVTSIAMSCSPRQGAVPVTLAPAQAQDKPASSKPAQAAPLASQPEKVPRASQPEKPAPVSATPSDAHPSEQKAEPPVASGPGWSIITTAEPFHSIVSIISFSTMQSIMVIRCCELRIPSIADFGFRIAE